MSRATKGKLLLFLTAQWIVVGLVAISGVFAAPVAPQDWSRRSNGYACQATENGISCVPTVSHGFGIALHEDFLFVKNLDTGKRVFFRYQP